MDCSVTLGRVALDRLRDVAQAAEGLGYHAIYFPDHLVSEGPERQPAGLASYELRRRKREWELSEVVLSGAPSSDLLERFAREILPHV